MVEARGVEPLSENVSYKLSPGAVRLLKFPPKNGGEQPFSFGSFMIHSTGKAYRTALATKSRPYPDRGTSGKDGRH